MSQSRLFQVRCPHCNRLAAEAVAGSHLRVKCVRCGRMFERDVPAS
jgi:phage FluMu protein Com